jgi:hypothetical protein
VVTDGIRRSWIVHTAPLGLLACFVACQSDYQFDTHARYEAPAGRYQVAVHATGHVRAGSDLSDRSTADVRIEPLSPGRQPVVRVTITQPKAFSYEVDGGETGNGQWPPAPIGALGDVLRRHGYEGPTTEFAEVQQAIEGALFGPKATLMDGQTRALRVLEVRFQ